MNNYFYNNQNDINRGVSKMPLTKLKHLLVPPDEQFFDLMQKQAEIAHSASKELYELLKDSQNVQKNADKIRDLEHQGDQLMRDLYTALNKTFIVPIDHSDIATLASALDDIIDLIDHVTTLLMIYKIAKPTPAMIQLGELVAEQTDELRNAVVSINHSKTYGQVAKHCNKIKGIENKADEIYIKAVEALFEKSEPIQIIKQKEILECLESTTDKVDRAAQHISDIVMKHS